MARYDFQDTKTKEIVELVYGWNEVPEIGKVVKVAGRRLRRVILPSTYQVGANAAASSSIVAKSIARYEKDASGNWQPPSDHGFYPKPTTDGRTELPGVTIGPRGEPCFEGVKARQEFLAKGEGTYAYGID